MKDQEIINTYIGLNYPDLWLKPGERPAKVKYGRIVEEKNRLFVKLELKFYGEQYGNYKYSKNYITSEKDLLELLNIYEKMYSPVLKLSDFNAIFLGNTYKICSFDVGFDSDSWYPILRAVK